MASKASISRISEATKEKIRELYVRYGVPKYALAQRFHIYPADVTRITKGLKSVEASREVQALALQKRSPRSTAIVPQWDGFTKVIVPASPDREESMARFRF